ncbi:MAG: PASTA domain-containing protein [Anaerolineae bacterium]|nr:PASTA domain-containing protein [Anaerolineae bacterium]
MRRQLNGFIGLIGLLLLFSAPTALMQDATVAVPSIVGMNVPQTAAVLNRVGLALGAQNNIGWTAESGLPQNTVGSQAPIPGQPVAPGTPVDVTVLRSPNVALMYDDNDITLINNTGAPLDLNGLTFNMVEGAAPASFAATRWMGALQAGGCAQLWSVLRSSPKDVEGCARINRWLTNVNNTSEHFWTGLNGVVSFNIVYNGLQYATCPAAPAGALPMRCETYLPSGSPAEVTPYLYFAYTPDRLIILNQSTDRWMPLDATPVINLNPNLAVPEAQINLTDPNLVTRINPVADVSLLAPNQCLLFTNNVSPEQPNLPQACDLVGQANIDPGQIFWSASFDIVSAADGQRRTCAPATPGRLTICILSR